MIPDGLLLSPIQISETAWYYEERKGIIVAVEHVDDAGRYLLPTDQITISWAKLAASVQRAKATGLLKSKKRSAK